METEIEELARRLKMTARILGRPIADVLREQAGRTITHRTAKKVAAAAGIGGW